MLVTNMLVAKFSVTKLSVAKLELPIIRPIEAYGPGSGSIFDRNDGLEGIMLLSKPGTLLVNRDRHKETEREKERERNTIPSI